jgi:hypothetical protein
MKKLFFILCTVLLLDTLWVFFDCTMRKQYAAQYISYEHARRFTYGKCIEKRQQEGHWW